MPKFEVSYSFDCPKCKAANNGVSEADAINKTAAIESVRAKVLCEKCGAGIEAKQPMPTGVKQLD
jgi:transcription elongation factor Elf1